MAITRTSTLTNETSGSFVISQSMAASFYAKKVEPAKSDRIFDFSLKLKTDASAYTAIIDSEAFIPGPNWTSFNFTSAVPVVAGGDAAWTTASIVIDGQYGFGSKGTPPDVSEYYFDDFKITADKPFTEVSQDGILIFNSEDNFIKMDASGLQVSGGNIMNSYLEASSIRCKSDIIVDNVLDLRNKIRFDGSSQGLIEGEIGAYGQPGQEILIVPGEGAEGVSAEVLGPTYNNYVGQGASGSAGVNLTLYGGKAGQGGAGGPIPPSGNETAGDGGLGGDVIIIAGTGGAGNDDQSDDDVAGCSDGGDGGNVYIAGGYKGLNAGDCHPPILSDATDGDVILGHTGAAVQGKVGIGEAAPDQLLHLTGTNPQICIEENSTEFVRIGVGATGHDMCLGWDDSDNMHFGVFQSTIDTSIDTHMIITSGGRVGIGDLTPDYPLDVDGEVSDISIWASDDIAAYSDIRVKTDIETITEPLNKVLKMRGVTFIRTDSSSDKRRMGVIAQEVEPYVPEVVTTRDDPDHKKHGHKSVSYGNLTALLIEAIKEQQEQIEELKQQVKEIKDG
jgi:putative lipoic acid-binding regulatory protein